MILPRILPRVFLYSLAVLVLPGPAAGLALHLHIGEEQLQGQDQGQWQDPVIEQRQSNITNGGDPNGFLDYADPKDRGTVYFIRHAQSQANVEASQYPVGSPEFNSVHSGDKFYELFQVENVN